ncbi:MAG: hypothetical protein HFI75_02290 [Lachnospiraceae bacterium]|nr:hypothetical protein [Lachnospiraceae bacterium]
MYEKDYIMRVIKEIVRTLIKLLFNIDTEKATDELLKDQNSINKLKQLLEMIENGQINEAENEVYDLIERGDRDQEQIKLAILFYAYLNDKDDEFLISHAFSREEIKEGLQNIARKCGVAGLTELY